jgi:hypothetical protein
MSWSSLSTDLHRRGRTVSGIITTSWVELARIFEPEPWSGRSRQLMSRLVISIRQLRLKHETGICLLTRHFRQSGTWLFPPQFRFRIAASFLESEREAQFQSRKIIIEINTFRCFVLWPRHTLWALRWNIQRGNLLFKQELKSCSTSNNRFIADGTRSAARHIAIDASVICVARLQEDAGQPVPQLVPCVRRRAGIPELRSSACHPLGSPCYLSFDE